MTTIQLDPFTRVTGGAVSFPSDGAVGLFLVTSTADDEIQERDVDDHSLIRTGATPDAAQQPQGIGGSNTRIYYREKASKYYELDPEDFSAVQSTALGHAGWGAGGGRRRCWNFRDSATRHYQELDPDDSFAIVQDVIVIYGAILKAECGGADDVALFDVGGAVTERDPDDLSVELRTESGGGNGIGGNDEYVWTQSGGNLSKRDYDDWTVVLGPTAIGTTIHGCGGKAH